MFVRCCSGAVCHYKAIAVTLNRDALLFVLLSWAISAKKKKILDFFMSFPDMLLGSSSIKSLEINRTDVQSVSCFWDVRRQPPQPIRMPSQLFSFSVFIFRCHGNCVVSLRLYISTLHHCCYAGVFDEVNCVNSLK